MLNVLEFIIFVNFLLLIFFFFKAARGGVSRACAGFLATLQRTYLPWKVEAHSCTNPSCKLNQEKERGCLLKYFTTYLSLIFPSSVTCTSSMPYEFKQDTSNIKFIIYIIMFFLFMITGIGLSFTVLVVLLKSMYLNKENKLF